MPPRLKSTVVVAFVFLALYMVFARSYGSNFYGEVHEHIIGVGQDNLLPGFQGDVGPEGVNPTQTSQTLPLFPVATDKAAWEPIPPNPDLWKTPTDQEGVPPVGDEFRHSPSAKVNPHVPANTHPSNFVGATPASPVVTKAPLGGIHPPVVPGKIVDNGSPLQEQFEKESTGLALNDTAEAIYGTTLQFLNDTGSHEGFKAAALIPTEFWSTYSDKRPYIYNPYPNYNSRSWKQNSRGMYKACLGPKGEITDLKVYSGHPEIFSEPLMGSYKVFETDSNLCFERETRLGPYGFIEAALGEPGTVKGDLDDFDIMRRDEWDGIDWGLLQQQCFKKNANRYASAFPQQQIIDHVRETATPSTTVNSTAHSGHADHIKRIDTIQDEENGRYNDEGEEYEEEVEKMEIPAIPFPKVTGQATKADTPATGYDHPTYKQPAVTPEEQEFEASNYVTPSVNPQDTDAGVGKVGNAVPSVIPQKTDAGVGKVGNAVPSVIPQKTDAGVGKVGNAIAENSPVTTEDEELAVQKEASGDMAEGKSRTAVIIRAIAGQNYTQNDRQNIRAMISELCLRSGGEYEVFLLVQVMDDSLLIWDDPKVYQKVVQRNIPKEFWNMTILWNDAKMKELYPLIPAEANNAHQSHWLPVQLFAQNRAEFAFFWNWELDSRYTGHYYDLFEKLDTFSKAQPRKYLWERNERYYVTKFHGPYPKFMKTVETISGHDTIWGPTPNTVAPAGPPKIVMNPSDDRYMWGKGEPADYISLAPIFNPVNSSWVGRDDIWGYEGKATPRRATVGTTSRCSRKLLNTMHGENLKGNHIGSEMAPQTVSLLHGLKAVYGPIPMFFDKLWSGESLNKYFNPGPKGVSGSSQDTPFGLNRESRFQGSTWYSHADAPMRLYNNWLGWEDQGLGGPEWEKINGRICLPPMLLRPVKNVINHGPGYSSLSDLA